jgi:hypothetical protein
MQAANYDRISNGCVIVAVLSALGFGELGHLRLLFGTLAIASGVAAVVVYFWNQGTSNRCESTVENVRPPEKQDLITLVRRTHEDSLRQMRFEHREEITNQMLVYVYEVTFTEVIGEKHKRHRTRVDDIVEIVDRLSRSSDEAGAYEFVLTNSGDFLIRPATREKHRLGQGYLDETEEFLTPSATPPLQKPN